MLVRIGLLSDAAREAVTVTREDIDSMIELGRMEKAELNMLCCKTL
jgi:hypothetical protein